ncbi:protein-tyrosine-phosphatase PTP1 [Selaginella moellendorffii]|nr:protein-tyrosine-phosphatase PTP1 [Selaginella moellendorffii]|eukprot:XP_002965416.2 protein-tyrosine-phosphatase PTP1 [Selaginella moellendorffii]
MELEWCSQALDALKTKTHDQAIAEYNDLRIIEAKELLQNLGDHPYCKAATRVELHGVRDTTGFVNANFIRHKALFGGPTAICAGNPDAPDRFWEMIVQQRCRAIVKLTAECYADYFPSRPGEFDNFGDIRVTNKSLQHSRFGVSKRVLEVESPGHEAFGIEHFQYSWTDFGVPRLVEPVLEIFEELYKLQPGCSYVVHCRAGIGRSGTFITIDHILRRILSGDLSAVNVADVVQYLRQQRGGLVETNEQYWFCFRAIIKHLECFLAQK